MQRPFLEPAMFVTLPQFREPAMTAMADNAGTYWRGLIADFPVLPWYLFLRKGRMLDAYVDQVVLVAWEETLIELVEATPKAARRAVYRVDPIPYGGLNFRVVSALWRASDRGNAEGFLAMLALEGASEPLDSFLHSVAPEYVGVLVYKANQSE
jgi:hypothetical protein